MNQRRHPRDFPFGGIAFRGFRTVVREEGYLFELVVRKRRSCEASSSDDLLRSGVYACAPAPVMVTLSNYVMDFDEESLTTVMAKQTEKAIAARKGNELV